MLDYEELVALASLDGGWDGQRYAVSGAPPALAGKLDRLLTEPFVSNEAYYAGSKPHRPKDAGLGTTLRAAVWNIERGQELERILEAFDAARDPDARAAFLATGVRPDAADTAAERDELGRQLDALARLDVLVLNEADVGMRRSGYAHVVERLAEKLGMNYAYGVEFVEIDPIALGLETFAREDFLAADAKTGQLVADESAEPDTLAAEAAALTAVDPSRLRNLHGNAVLSRYPILQARLERLAPRQGCWDWNRDEKAPRAIAGLAQDFIAAKLFLQKSMREIRHGGRIALYVDLLVPGVNAVGTSLQYVPGERQNVVTVAGIHLEAKSTPSCRRGQMLEALAHLGDAKNPVILAGDLNTVGTDGRPMTVERLLLSRFADPEWIARQLLGRLSPYVGWAFLARDVLNWFRLKDDPTGVHIPFLLPNEERGLFDAVEDFAFPDGGRFDFRGDKSRTVNGTAKTLANSNQRDKKGFKTTFAFARTLDVGGVTVFGNFKLDWMFVRGYARAPRDERASYRMAPHWSRTLEELRDATAPRLSDHAPMTVVLPLGDPCPEQSCPSDPEGGLEFGGASWQDAWAAEGQ
jgi:endonuclease/exonuclease/phosphatase family metal-dependent hydrolase